MIDFQDEDFFSIWDLNQSICFCKSSKIICCVGPGFFFNSVIWFLICSICATISSSCCWGGIGGRGTTGGGLGRGGSGSGRLVDLRIENLGGVAALLTATGDVLVLVLGMTSLLLSRGNPTWCCSISSGSGRLGDLRSENLGDVAFWLTTTGDVLVLVLILGTITSLLSSWGCCCSISSGVKNPAVMGVVRRISRTGGRIILSRWKVHLLLLLLVSSSSVAGCWRRRRRNKIPSAARIPRKATPPRVPPTMAPTFFLRRTTGLLFNI